MVIQMGQKFSYAGRMHSTGFLIKTMLKATFWGRRAFRMKSCQFVGDKASGKNIVRLHEGLWRVMT